MAEASEQMQHVGSRNHAADHVAFQRHTGNTSKADRDHVMKHHVDRKSSYAAHGHTGNGNDASAEVLREDPAGAIRAMEAELVEIGKIELILKEQGSDLSKLTPADVLELTAAPSLHFLLAAILQSITAIRTAREAAGQLDVERVRDAEERLSKLTCISRLVEDAARMRSLCSLPCGIPVISLNMQNSIQGLLLQLYNFDLLLSERKLSVNFSLLDQASLEMDLQSRQRPPQEEEKMRRSLGTIHYRLKAIHEEMEDYGATLSMYEHELLILRQELQKSAQLAMGRTAQQRAAVGVVAPTSEQILAVENGLKQVQQRAVSLHARRQEILDCIQRMQRTESFEELIPAQAQIHRNLASPHGSPQKYRGAAGVYRAEPFTISSSARAGDGVGYEIEVLPPKSGGRSRSSGGSHLHVYSTATAKTAPPQRRQEQKQAVSYSPDGILSPSHVEFRHFPSQHPFQASSPNGGGFPSPWLLQQGPPAPSAKTTAQNGGKIHNYGGKTKNDSDSSRSARKYQESPEHPATEHQQPQRPSSAASSVGSATSFMQSEEEEEMLNLIDQLTDQMFAQPDKDLDARRTNSLPRLSSSYRPNSGNAFRGTGGGGSLYKSSSGTLYIKPVRTGSLSRGSGAGGLSAYERLFGRPPPAAGGGAGTSSQLAGSSKKTTPKFITKGDRRQDKAGDRVGGSLYASFRLADESQSRPMTEAGVPARPASSASTGIIAAASSRPKASPATAATTSLPRRSQPQERLNSCYSTDTVTAAKPPAAGVSLDRIDRLLGAPDKIAIPERFQPEAEEAPRGAFEVARREEKVAAIRRMLGEGVAAESGGGSSTKDTMRLLTLNQIIAQQVKARSRTLAATAAAATVGDKDDDHRSSADSSPDIPLPMRQQRESFLI